MLLDHRVRQLLLAAALAAVAPAPLMNRAAGEPPEAAEAAHLDADFKVAEALQGRGKFAEAADLLKAAVGRIRVAFPAGHPEIANALAGFGHACALANDYRAAEAALREALEMTKARPVETGDLRLSVRNNLVEVLVRGGKSSEALDLCEESVKDAEKTYGAGDRRTNQARETLAKVYLSAKRPADAIQPAQDALKRAEAAANADDPQTIPFRHTLAMAFMAAARFREAEGLLKKSEAIAAKLPPGHEYVQATANGLAALYQQTERHREAAVAAKKAVGGEGGAGPSADPVLLSNQATISMLAGRYDEADAEFQKALALARDRLGEDHPDTSTILANLAHLNTLRGRFADAERYAIRSLDAVRKNPGRGTVAEAKGESGLAAIYSKTGRLEDAAPLLKSALATLTLRLGADHPDAIDLRHNLAALGWSSGDFERAVKDGEEAWSALEKRGIAGTTRAGLVLVNLGQAYFLLGRLAEAKDRLTRAVDVFNKLGLASADSAVADSALAGYLQLVGERREAEGLLLRAVKTLEAAASRGSDHPDTCAAMDNLAVFYACGGDWKAAEERFQQTRRLRREFLLRTLPALSEDDQISLIETGERLSRDAALSLAVQRRHDPEVAARSAEWVLNAKALSLSALAERSVRAREPDNPEAARLRAERDELRGRLAMLSAIAADRAADGSGRTPAGAPADDYKALAGRERDLSRRLGLALPPRERNAPWVELKDVRAALPADGVLVEYVRIYLTEYATDVLRMPRPKFHYAAWVIPPAGPGDVTLVDLGPADIVERSIDDALRAITSAPADERSGERAAQACLATLARAIVEPLGLPLNAARRWMLSPDAALWLVPWAALPSGEDRYAVEDRLIHLTTSGRDAVAPPPAGTSNTPAIFADPAFDLDADESPGVPGPDVPPARFKRLKSSGAEAAAVVPLIRAYSGRSPDVFLGARASETAFKGLRSPRVLLMSTHGAFVDAPGLTEDGRPPALQVFSPIMPHATGGGAVLNPLLHGSLVLAGYSNRAPARPGAASDDGLLTGLEVVGVDLSGTELVVLSACETALGKALPGEGVAGIRQAFQIAGASAVVATLWQVQDVETCQLIAAMFEGLAGERSTARSLREAQLALIADRRARHGDANPYYWAAFTLTGYPGAAWREEPLATTQGGDLPSIRPFIPEKGSSFDSGSKGREPVSPLTGQPDSRRPWADLSLACVLLSGFGYAARRWWMLPRRLTPT